MLKKSAVQKTAILASLLALGSTGALCADDLKPSYDADPSVYKVIAESNEMRVILATWPAGYKDKLHTHPKSHAGYSLTDCTYKLISADGKISEKQWKAGSARVVGPNKGHQFQNAGNNNCQAVLVELK